MLIIYLLLNLWYLSQDHSLWESLPGKVTQSSFLKGLNFSLILHSSTYHSFPLTFTIGYRTAESYPKNVLVPDRVIFAPIVWPQSPDKISPSNRVIPFFTCWLSGRRSPQCQVAVSSSNPLEPLLHPLVEVFLPWVPRPSNQENSKLWGQEAKLRYKTILII